MGLSKELILVGEFSTVQNCSAFWHIQLTHLTDETSEETFIWPGMYGNGYISYTYSTVTTNVFMYITQPSFDNFLCLGGDPMNISNLLMNNSTFLPSYLHTMFQKFASVPG